MSPPSLHVQLDAPLPPEVVVGAGTAVFVCGWCFSPQGEIARLEFVLDGAAQPVDSFAMPRLDPLRALPSEPQSYRSGFWGLVRIAAPPGNGGYELALRARLADGARAEAGLGRIAAAELPQPLPVAWPLDGGPPRVAIAMATYNPPSDLLARQLESLRAQTHENWICVVSDDASSRRHVAEIEREVAGDPRFVVSRSPRRRGFYGNFERALALTPGDADYVALADQDDDWHPEKLARLLETVGEAQLAYSDARVLARDGRVISDTWWDRRRNNHRDLLSLLVANSVTGAASLLRRDLLDYALPFPPAQFQHFHDHWLGLVALSLGGIAYTPEALYDYIQHGQASLGHAMANRMTSLRERLAHQRRPRERVHMWRMHYFVDIWRLRQFATVLLMRAGPAMSEDQRRRLERFLDADRSLASLTEMGFRGARELVGTPETLGAEWGLFHALAWRRLLGLTTRRLPQRRLRLDAIPPASLIQKPGWKELNEDVAQIASKIEPLRWHVDETAPVRVNLLIPSIDLAHLFGGYIAKFNLARRLAERGLRVRIVTVDPIPPLPPDWRRRVESFAGLERVFESVEVAFGRESSQLPVSPHDGFIATTWWTAHIAAEALEQARADRFLYLIQEYEPFTFPMGTYYALAADSYRRPHYALFSTELLRDYFRRHGLGVYAAGAAAGDRDSLAFENAITQVAPVPEADLRARRPRRLLFYARPEAHAARNMYELGVLGLAQAVQQGTFDSDWELAGIGSVAGGGEIPLGPRTMRLLTRVDQARYGELLREHDVGLALMYTPHPSLVPLEMAAAGLVTVTNAFENKTPAALGEISSNLVVVEPTVEGVAAGLRAAVDRAGDTAARLAGAEVNWSTSWRRSFGDELIEQLLGYLSFG